MKILEELIPKSEVTIRGWSYPYYKRDKLIRGNNYIGCFVEWQNHLESWQLYQSGQYIHYLGLWEDWLDRNRSLFGSNRYAGITAGTILDVSMAVYSITEIYIFLQRLTFGRLFEQGLNINLELRSTANRRLGKLDPNRLDFSQDYHTNAEVLTYSKSLSQKDILSQYKKLARDAIHDFFGKFGWHNNHETNFVENSQDEILQGRF